MDEKKEGKKKEEADLSREATASKTRDSLSELYAVCCQAGRCFHSLDRTDTWIQTLSDE